MAQYAGDSPCARIDDELGAVAFAWAQDREAETLLLRTVPSDGLTEQHVWRLEGFGRTVTEDD